MAVTGSVWVSSLLGAIWRAEVTISVPSVQGLLGVVIWGASGLFRLNLVGPVVLWFACNEVAGVSHSGQLLGQPLPWGVGGDTPDDQAGFRADLICVGWQCE